MLGNAAALLQPLSEIRLYVVWLGLGVLTLGLLLMLVTRWGDSKPVGKCLVLSLLGHCLLGMYAYTVIVVQEVSAEPEEPTFQIQRVDLVDPLDPGDAPEPVTAVWDRFVHRGPIETVPIQTPRPAVPEAPTIQRQLEETELPAEYPDSEVPLEAATLPDPGQLVHTEARAQAVRAEPAVISDVPAAQRQDPGETPLPGIRETRLRPLGGSAPPTPRRAAPITEVDTAFSEPILRHRRRQPADQIGPTAARIDSVDVPSRRGGTQQIRPGPVDLLDGPASSAERAAATRPAVPASPSLRHRPGPAGTSGPTLVRRSRASRGAFSEKTVPTRSAFPSAGKSRSSQPAPEQPRTAQTAPNSVRFRNRARIPATYRLRTAPDRRAVAIQRGGSERSEQAVETALEWLAAHQDRDGRWDADGFTRHCPPAQPCSGAAGRERRIGGQDRAGAGRNADAGMTALALLAFLGAGYTHQQGPYAETVSRGLNWLVTNQAEDGNLAGQADSFAFMYCHGMATIAVGEAYGMSGDAGLLLPLRRAVAYLIANQDPASGGWRYKDSRQGDTSVMGWQVMALRSAESAGLAVPLSTRQQIRKYLASVASGRFGGLASYRPRESVTPSMTAEALVCLQLLGRQQSHPASEEAAEYLLRNLPESASYNLYYWYYATLGLYHYGGEAWQAWNRSVRDNIVDRQNGQAHARGSWDPTSYWSAYGGRIYSTAMAALCLEVYYRYLPLYSQTDVPLTRSFGDPSPAR